MKLKTAYLIIAILGALVPVTFFANFAAEEGINLVSFIGALFVNGAAGGFTADLLISSFVFWIYMFSNRSAGPKPGCLLRLIFALVSLALCRPTCGQRPGPVTNSTVLGDCLNKTCKPRSFGDLSGVLQSGPGEQRPDDFKKDTGTNNRGKNLSTHLRESFCGHQGEP